MPPIAGVLPVTCARLANPSQAIAFQEACECVGSRRQTSLGEVGKCAPEDELSKEPKMAAIGAAVAERHVREYALHLAARCPFGAHRASVIIIF